MKRAAGGASAASVVPKRVRGAAKPDWRATMFFWRGEIKLADGLVSWTGSWVGSDGPEPAAAAFTSSPHTFTVRGPARDRTSFKVADEVGPDASDRGTCDFDWEASSYILDVGEAPKSDDEHHFVVLEGGEGCMASTVSAFGCNEFGRFVSFGFMTDFSPDARTAVLTLARRYVRDDDPRAAVRSAAALRSEMARRRAEGTLGDATPQYSSMLPVRVKA